MTADPERIAKQTGPDRLLPRRSFLGVLGGALAAGAYLTSQPESLRTAAGILVPRTAEAADKTRIFKCGLLPYDIQSLGAVRAKETTPATVESLMNPDYGYPVDSPTWINRCSVVNARNHPEWNIKQVEVQWAFAGFENRISDIQALEDTNLNYATRAEALFASIPQFSRYFAGQLYTFKRIQPDNKPYILLKDTQSYQAESTGPNVILTDALAKIAPKDYQANTPYKIYVFLYLTSNNADLNSFQFLGGITEKGYGMALAPAVYLEYLKNGKIAKPYIWSLIHEIMHGEGNTHYEDLNENGTENSVMRIRVGDLPYVLMTKTDLDGKWAGSDVDDPKYDQNRKPRLYIAGAATARKY